MGYAQRQDQPEPRGRMAITHRRPVANLPISRKINALPDLTGNEKLLLATICVKHHNNESGRCDNLNADFAKELKPMSVPTITRTLKRLQDKRYVVVHDGKAEGNKRWIEPTKLTLKVYGAWAEEQVDPSNHFDERVSSNWGEALIILIRASHQLDDTLSSICAVPLINSDDPLLIVNKWVQVIQTAAAETIRARESAAAADLLADQLRDLIRQHQEEPAARPKPEPQMAIPKSQPQVAVALTSWAESDYADDGVLSALITSLHPTADVAYYLGRIGEWGKRTRPREDSGWQRGIRSFLDEDANRKRLKTLSTSTGGGNGRTSVLDGARELLDEIRNNGIKP